MADPDRTTTQVAGMSKDARSELARSLAQASSDSAAAAGASYRRDRPVRREPAPRDRTGRRPGKRESDAEAAEVARLATNLHKAERRLKVNADVLTEGRKVRLTSRTKRLKRQLRKIS